MRGQCRGDEERRIKEAASLGNLPIVAVDCARAGTIAEEIAEEDLRWIIVRRLSELKFLPP